LTPDSSTCIDCLFARSRRRVPDPPSLAPASRQCRPVPDMTGAPLREHLCRRSRSRSKRVYQQAAALVAWSLLLAAASHLPQAAAVQCTVFTPGGCWYTTARPDTDAEPLVRPRCAFRCAVCGASTLAAAKTGYLSCHIPDAAAGLSASGFSDCCRACIGRLDPH